MQLYKGFNARFGQCPKNAGRVSSPNGAIDRRCRRNDVARLSYVMAAIRRPISLIRPMACWPHAPGVSMPTGAKSTSHVISWYLWHFLIFAFAAAEPASSLHAVTWHVAKVSGHVASQTKHRPRCLGIWVTPSGRLPLFVHRYVALESPTFPNCYYYYYYYINTVHWMQWKILLMPLMLF